MSNVFTLDEFDHLDPVCPRCDAPCTGDNGPTAVFYACGAVLLRDIGAIGMGRFQVHSDTLDYRGDNGDAACQEIAGLRAQLYVALHERGAA